MITLSDSYNTIEAKDLYYYSSFKINNFLKYLKFYKAKKLKNTFRIIVLIILKNCQL